jgi:hypothetical protein
LRIRLRTLDENDTPSNIMIGPPVLGKGVNRTGRFGRP